MGRRYRVSMAVLVIGALVTAAAVLAASSTYDSNEKHLLELRTKEVASVLMAAIPNVQTPLASGAAIADATRGTAEFKRFMAGFVGRGPQHPFVSVALFRRDRLGAGPLVRLGVPPILASPANGPELFGSTRPGLRVKGLLRGPERRIAYAVAGAPGSPLVTYAESSLPRSRRSPIQRNAAFSDLDYALYLGPHETVQTLLLTSVARPPLQGRTDTSRIPFGTSSLAVVVAARHSLSGSLAKRLPLIAGILGAVLTLAGALVSLRLVAGRRTAERIAEEQRTIADTLQHALLPQRLPEVAGLESSVRYRPGGEGVEVGGDWYDLIELGEHRLLLVIGDVSGRGLRAAATMATLRFAIQAFVSQGDPPERFMTKLSQLVNVRTNGHIATVLCVVIDAENREVSLTSAGHLPPLLIGPDGSEYLEGEVGVPVGVDWHPAYTAHTVTLPPGATLLAFTDGLVERRGEDIERGLERLREHAGHDGATLDAVLDRVLTRMDEGNTVDDTAIAGVRWLS